MMGFICEAVSQSCAVAKSEDFWRATGKSNLADRMEDCSTDHRAVVEFENLTLEAFVAATRLYTKFDCPVPRQKSSLLATAHNCETGA